MVPKPLGGAGSGPTGSDVLGDLVCPARRPERSRHMIDWRGDGAAGPPGASAPSRLGPRRVGGPCTPQGLPRYVVNGFLHHQNPYHES